MVCFYQLTELRTSKLILNLSIYVALFFSYVALVPKCRKRGSFGKIVELLKLWIAKGTQELSE